MIRVPSLHVPHPLHVFLSELSLSHCAHENNWRSAGTVLAFEHAQAWNCPGDRGGLGRDFCDRTSHAVARHAAGVRHEGVSFSHADSPCCPALCQLRFPLPERGRYTGIRCSRRQRPADARQQRAGCCECLHAACSRSRTKIRAVVHLYTRWRAAEKRRPDRSTRG